MPSEDDVDGSPDVSECIEGFIQLRQVSDKYLKN